MIKFWATLLVASTWTFFSFAFADDNVSKAGDTVIRHDVFLKRQEQRRKELASDPQKKCETKLADVIPLPLVENLANDPDADALAIAVRAEMNSNYVLAPPPRDPFFGLGRSIQLLGETADRPMNDAILRLKIAALEKVALRLYKRTLGAEPQPFWNGELVQYCRLLTLATQGIFYGHSDGENPIARVTAFFKQQQQHLPKNEKLELVGALLRGVDLEEAILADDDFIVLVDLWFSNRSLSGSSLNIAIQRKINEVAKQDDRFRSYVIPL
jgi:hypothetical protein